MCTVNGANGSVFRATTPEMYEPMEIPEHIYLNGVPRKAADNETRPAMIVPPRITIAEGETMVEGKTQPTKMPENDGINMSFIPDMLTAAIDLPRHEEDLIQHQNGDGDQILENPHYSSQTSIAVEKNPLNELKKMRRRNNLLSKRVQNLEMENDSYKKERPYIFGAFAITILLSICAIIRSNRR